jgi:hypothetical protein
VGVFVPGGGVEQAVRVLGAENKGGPAERRLHEAAEFGRVHGLAEIVPVAKHHDADRQVCGSGAGNELGRRLAEDF